ncbi:MAG: dUTP diphosphatase [Phycisphaeraceae bacterium]|nr:dUTP diphosphatase [Phycisphaeraceae bacterium]
MSTTSTNTSIVPCQIKRLAGNADSPLPAYQSEHAAGMDVHAFLSENVTIEPGKIVLVPTGFAIAVPEGYEAQLRPRSGLACKFGVTLPNCTGTIDADYRGEVKVALINLGESPFTVEPGMRICQMIVKEVPKCVWQEVDELSDTVRGSGGFGHTGH